MKLMVIMKNIFPDSVSEQDYVKSGTHLNSLLSYLPERGSCFVHTKQLCIKDCLQDLEFLKFYIKKHLAKVAKTVNSIRKSVNATTHSTTQKNNFTIKECYKMELGACYAAKCLERS